MNSCRKKSSRGSLSLELVIVLPILMLVLLTIVQWSSYLMATETIQAAAMAGAREASLPGADEAEVRAAVLRALSGWSFADAIGTNGVQIQDLPKEDSVSVTVSVDTDKAAINALLTIPGFSLAGKQIRGQYVMRKE